MPDVCLADQATIAPDECVECGGWLHVEERGGYPAPGSSFRVCSQFCVESWVEHQGQAHDVG